VTDPDLLEEVGHWLRYACEDLRTAELIVGQGGVPRTACFHAQQAAEKAIKASLLFLQTGFPKTHDLELLANRLPEGWRLAEDPSTLSDLSDWAVEPRYPGYLREATEDDTEAAIKQAREVLQTTLEDLKSHGYAPDEEEVRREGEEEE
jgi:HEPN domain-containing protein